MSFEQQIIKKLSELEREQVSLLVKKPPHNGRILFLVDYFSPESPLLVIEKQLTEGLVKKVKDSGFDCHLFETFSYAQRGIDSKEQPKSIEEGLKTAPTHIFCLGLYSYLSLSPSLSFSQRSDSYFMTQIQASNWSGPCALLPSVQELALYPAWRQGVWAFLLKNMG